MEAPGSEKERDDVLRDTEQVFPAACGRDPTTADIQCNLWRMHNTANGYLLEDPWLMENPHQRIVLL